MRACWSARKARDRGALEAMLDQTVELVGLHGYTLSGREAVIEAWLAEPAFDHLTLEATLHAVECVNERCALAIVDQTYRWRETGELAHTARMSSLYELRRTRIVRVTFYSDVDAARTAAAGLNSAAHVSL